MLLEDAFSFLSSKKLQKAHTTELSSFSYKQFFWLPAFQSYTGRLLFVCRNLKQTGPKYGTLYLPRKLCLCPDDIMSTSLSKISFTGLLR
jgi:hypothetical protein